MRKLIYIIIAIFLVLALYIIIIKSAPNKTPAGIWSGETGVVLQSGIKLPYPPSGIGGIGVMTISPADPKGIPQKVFPTTDDRHPITENVGADDPIRPVFVQQQAISKLLIETMESTGATIINAERVNSPLTTGTFPGQLSYDETEDILTKIFNDLDAEKIQKMRDGNLISWGGYSPKIPFVLRDLTGEPINIQGALRYNSSNDHTYIFLGSPVIYIEY